MPELPEVETLRQDLDKEVGGRKVKAVEVRATKVVRRHRNRKEFADRLVGRKLGTTARLGSMLLVGLDGGPDSGDPGRGVPTGRRTWRRPLLRQLRGWTTTSSTGAGRERPIRTSPISTPKKSTLESVRSFSQSRPRRNSSWNRGATQITTAASSPEAWTIIWPSWLWSVASRRFSITMGRPVASAPSTLKAPVSALISCSSGVMSIPRVSLSRSMFWRNQGVRSGSCSPQNDLRSSRSSRPRPSRSISVLATRAPSDRPPERTKGSCTPAR